MITGSIPLENLVWEDFGNGIIRTQLPQSILTKLGPLSQLFVGDIPAIRARTPNIINFLSWGYNVGRGTVKGWGHPRSYPPLTKTINKVIVPFDDPNVQYLKFVAPRASCQPPSPNTISVAV